VSLSHSSPLMFDVSLELPALPGPAGARDAGVRAEGGGAAEQMDVEADVDIHVGTLSKAVGAMGGFVACS